MRVSFAGTKLYEVLVEKNPYVKKEYDDYIRINRAKGKKSRFLEWFFLVRVKAAYFILNRGATKEEILISNENVSVKPYESGPESTKRRCSTPYRFAAELMKYDVISFDIFDTLVFRRLNQPADVFMLVGKKLGILNYQFIRENAEQEVRNIKYAEYGNREVTFADIYKRVAYKTGIDQEYGMSIEFETELDMCFANPYMMRVFEILRTAGKRIFATSNMYLPKDKMKILLEHCGYYGFENILVSCDYHCEKGSGELFQVLKRQIGENISILHVGDNMETDIEGAEKARVEARYYPACRELGDPHRSRGNSVLVGSAYYGIVNTSLHNGTYTYSSLWEVGFVYGGLLAIGFTNWIYKKAVQDGVTKVLFLSRDGFLFKQVYDMFFHDIDSEYVFWSRAAAIRSGTERNYFIRKLVLDMVNKATVADILETADLQSLSSIFTNENISLSTLITNNNKKYICRILLDHWNDIEQLLVKNRDTTETYIQQIVAGHEKIAFVDMGPTGGNVLILNNLLELCGMANDNVKVYLLQSEVSDLNGAQILEGKISCYMFDESYNREIRDHFCAEKPVSHDMLEKMFSAAHPSFRGINSDGEMDFSPSEAENNKAVSEIQRGILDFCREYAMLCKEYPDFLNVTGYDAYVPLRLLLSCKDYTQKVLENIVQASIHFKHKYLIMENFGGEK